jgi:hypothetical protein
MFVVEHSAERNRDRRPGAGLKWEEPSPRGQALNALRASYLLDRFYSWRGISGERYVCSIFSLEEETIVAGFSQAVIIGVACDPRGRQPVCLLSCGEFASEVGRIIRSEARALGVTEWHVHFGSGDAVFRDLADSLLN